MGPRKVLVGMGLLWQTWNELARVEGVGTFEHLTRFDQLGQFVRDLFDLMKKFLTGFLRVKRYDFNKMILSADSIVGVGKQADELVSVVGRLSEQNYVEGLLVGAIYDRGLFGEPRKALSAVSALVTVSLQRDTPS
jgi:hypothetical protein